jgi:exosortase A
VQNKTEFGFNLKSQSQQVIYLLAFIFIAWIAFFWQGIVTAVDIWLISDIFNHCLFVLPGAFFLIYLKRKQLSYSLVKPAWWGLFFCAGSALLYLIGIAGDVQLFMHVATFTFLPFAIWTCAGNKVAKLILFPLFFMLFCIPFGEEFVPALQEIAANLSVMMLNWTSIPVFRSGLYIEIPQGRFLVAEACSGISFFIASVVIGSLYSYLNIYSAKRRIWFVTLSIVVPIIANAVRVFGIIVIAYLSDMEYAVGADHLIYGWFFFAFVIILLLAVGELVREKYPPAEQNNAINQEQNSGSPSPNYVRLALGFMVFYLVFFTWLQHIHSQKIEMENPPELNTTALQTLVVDARTSQWEPKFNDAFDAYSATIALEENQFDIFIAWYPVGHGELISSLHRFYQEKEWTLQSSSHYDLDSAVQLPLSIIVNGQGYRALTYWYVIDGKVFTDKRLAKLYEIYRLMLGTHEGGIVVAISADIELVNKTQDLTDFKQNVQKTYALLRSQLIYP